MQNSSHLTVKQIKNHLEISTRYHRPGHVMSNHWHDYFEFEMVLDGAYEHTVSGEKKIAERGSAWIMTPLDYHSLTCLSDTILVNISFTGEDIDSEITNLLSSSAGGFLCEFDEETTANILNKCERARREMADKPPLWDCSVTNIVEDIIVTAIRNALSKKEFTYRNTPPLLQSVTAYLHKNHKSDLSLSTVAKVFGISPGHLGMIFGKTFGTSYNSYVTRIRLRHACNLLTNSNLSTKEIAFQCGFNSIEYFFYSFRKHLDTTPKEYRTNAT